MIWKDTTTRSQQDPDKPASCWTLDTGKVRITVMNSHRDDPGEWVLNCHQVNFSVKRLGISPDTSQEAARVAGLNMVKKELRGMLESLGG